MIFDWELMSWEYYVPFTSMLVIFCVASGVILSTRPRRIRVQLKETEEVKISVKSITWMVRYLGYTGCLLLGPGTVILIHLFYVGNQESREIFYCKEGFGASLEQRYEMNVLPTISRVVEHWPHYAAFVLGVGVTHICLGTILMSLLYQKCSVKTLETNTWWYHPNLVPGLGYGVMLLMWALIGSCMRGNGPLWANTLHGWVALVVFSGACITEIVFVIQHHLFDHPVVRLLAPINVLALCGCVVGALMNYPFQPGTSEWYFAISVLPVSEYIFVTSLAALAAYTFYSCVDHTRQEEDLCFFPRSTI
jgi:hypothetical protein